MLQDVQVVDSNTQAAQEESQEWQVRDVALRKAPSSQLSVHFPFDRIRGVEHERHLEIPSPLQVRHVLSHSNRR